jgi:hypothetical protein
MFSEYLESQQRHDLDLKMRLTLPLNHIAMYERLLRRIMFHSNPDDEDFQCLIGALTIMEETANFIRNSLAQADNRASLMRIQRSLAVPSGVRMQNLLSNVHRNFMNELAVDIQRPTVAPATPRSSGGSTSSSSSLVQPQGHVFLFSDIFLVARCMPSPKGSTAQGVAASAPQYQVEWQFPLDRTVVAEVSSTTFSIAETDDNGSELAESVFHITFAQPSKTHEWYALLRESIEHNQPNRGMPGTHINVLVTQVTD